MGGLKNAHLFIAITLIVGGGFFVLAVTSTFTLFQVVHSRFEPTEMVFLNFLAGLVEIVIGYESMVIFGGRFSLGIADFASRLGGSKQVIEVRKEEPTELKHRLIREAYLAYAPLIVFFITVAIAWDFYNADSIHMGIFRPVFHQLDIFSRAISVNVVLYSIGVTPLIVLFTFLGGIVPSISLPYFRKFKVTGVNSGPFHTTFLVSLVGVVAGISALLTLSGLFYELLLVGKTPLYYHYILLVAVGFSLYFGVGSYLGLERAEKMIKDALSRMKEGSKAFEGSVALTRAPAG